ncbi:MAG: phosphate ABC transporter substrate-binding protein PstS family protein [Actinomycetota bacterium]
MKRSRPSVVALVTAAAVLALGACGSGSSSGGGGGASGDVIVTGSSTVEPISSRVNELFAESNPDATVRVDGPGTGDGFQQFCNGEADINDASRPIKEEEAALCAENGVKYVELPVALDGLSVVTNPANAAVECLSDAQLYGLIGPESEGIDTWAGANELVDTVGGNGDLPDAPLEITGPGEESGTYDAFVELALSDIAEERVKAGDITEEQAGTTRPDYSTQSNDNAIIEGIAGSDTSLGWVGYAFADLNRETVKLLEVDGGGGCIAPTPETVADGSYPLSRTLYIYVDVTKAKANPALKAFVDFYLGPDGLQAVTDADYVQLGAEAWAATGTKWAAAVK